ncbi:host recBCD nuclease inhibitor protein [Rhizobium phage RHph_Y68]|uniref:Host recBCD nuclease inhibitor protein n=1 Tax=Rhizobium phage RHph_Y68 TaxID=2509787 RepID=A0A7S5USE8_9CAUD|nr:host recBCD nuclease inhibitor protein [Rhizobium phage RHph_Y68]QIG68133.1 host recBCD nuclease inhibitor protein [Rhizobium phage RHph_Y68]
MTEKSVEIEMAGSVLGTATLPFEEYVHLVKRDAMLTSLEFEGVQKWEGYEKAKKRAEDNS